MLTYTHTHTHTCQYRLGYVYIHTHTHNTLHVSTDWGAYILTHTHTHTSVQTGVRTYTRTYTSVDWSMYILTHQRTHTHTHHPRYKLSSNRANQIAERILFVTIKIPFLVNIGWTKISQRNQRHATLTSVLTN